MGTEVQPDSSRENERRESGKNRVWITAKDFSVKGKWNCCRRVRETSQHVCTWVEGGDVTVQGRGAPEYLGGSGWMLKQTERHTHHTITRRGHGGGHEQVIFQRLLFSQ